MLPVVYFSLCYIREKKSKKNLSQKVAGDIRKLCYMG